MPSRRRRFTHRWSRSTVIDLVGGTARGQLTQAFADVRHGAAEAAQALGRPVPDLGKHPEQPSEANAARWFALLQGDPQGLEPVVPSVGDAAKVRKLANDLKE